jgi:hypothetical protein
LRAFNYVFTISRELKGTPESRFNLEEAVTKTANPSKPLGDIYTVEFSIELWANSCAYLRKVGVLHVDVVLGEIVPGCIYPSESLPEIRTHTTPKKPMVALNS